MPRNAHWRQLPQPIALVGEEDQPVGARAAPPAALLLPLDQHFDRLAQQRRVELGDDARLQLVQCLAPALLLLCWHVVGVATVAASTRRGDDARLRLACPASLRRYVAGKGSVALNGVSLTVSRVEAAGFEIALIPQTLVSTNLGALRAGSRVNVEVDLVARYLEVLSAAGRGRQGRG